MIVFIVVTLLARLAGLLNPGGEAATPLVQRSIEQIVYFAAILWAGFGRATVRRS
ncbi:hypothetical protein [Cystobacter ferrugineus]|uniref:hypothetical protein n=1 Tax=Cystobacter ferrugineus TaxID=83449 RepID=UPI000AED128F|nr:hypothetical protein [Cystobacter ferrugineus]